MEKEKPEMDFVSRVAWMFLELQEVWKRQNQIEQATLFFTHSNRPQSEQILDKTETSNENETTMNVCDQFTC